MSEVDAIVQALRQGSGLAGNAGRGLVNRNMQNEEALMAAMAEQQAQQAGMQAPPMQDASGVGADGMSPMQRYQLEQARRQMTGQ